MKFHFFFWEKEMGVVMSSMAAKEKMGMEKVKMTMREVATRTARTTTPFAL